MAVIYKCSECGTKIRSEDGTPPDDCPACEARVASDLPDDVIPMPSIRSRRTDRVDQVYRDIEKGSEVRMNVAAEHLGVPVSEMSDMKITNLNDRRDAEIAAMPVINDVTRHMAATGVGGFGSSVGGQPAGAQYAQGTGAGVVTHDGKVVGQGIEPRAGARANADLQRLLNR